MKLQQILAALALAAAPVACTLERDGAPEPIPCTDTIEFTAAWADNEDEGTKTAIQSNGVNIWWTRGEEINVFFASGAEGKFTSTNTTAQATATFSGKVSGFVGNIEQNADSPYTWAVYPYSDANSFDGNSVTLTLPSEQHATEGTFADKFFPAIARTKGLDLAFYNVCGGVRFSCMSSGITSIVFKSNDGSPMAGKVKVGFSSNNKPGIREILEPIDSIKVIAPNGGFVPGMYYFAAMIPQTHVGLDETFLRGEHIQNKSISRITVKRSVFGKLNDIDKGLVNGLSLDKSELMLEKGTNAQLKATVTPSDATNKSIKWTSSNPSVASVYAGKVTAVCLGSAIITATTVDGGFTATCEVTVVPYASPEAIDLGLPSGLKWASFNLGATKPQEYGVYFAWGETEFKGNYDWSTYKWCNGSYNTLTKYNTKSSYGTVDNKGFLDPEDDAAAVALGGSWRMPTDAEWGELRNNCTRTWTADYNGTGVAGIILTSNIAGYTDKSIFLPAAGYRVDSKRYDAVYSGNYWSSSLYADSPNIAWILILYCSSDIYKVYLIHSCLRFSGLSVRPVSE